MRIKDIIKDLIGVLFILVLSVFTYLYVDSIFKNIKVDSQIIDFINKGTLERDYASNIKIYAVYTEEEIEDTISIEDEIFLGNNGDIYIMPESRATVFNIINSFISFLFGGHAGVHADINSTHFLIESFGLSGKEGVMVTKASDSKYDLISEDRSILGIRVKTSKENRNIATSYGRSLEGLPYNHLFIIDTENKYYCTDLANRIYSESVGINIDETDLYTTAQELVLSGETYISYYKFEYNGIIYIYHLVKK